MTAHARQRWISEAAEALGLPPSRFRVLPAEEAARVCGAVRDRFVAGSCGPRWWNGLRGESASAHFAGESSLAYQLLAEVVPPTSGSLWLIVEDEPAFAACEGRIEEIVAVLGERPGFEYYVVPRDLAWLVCENDHDVLIAVGDEARTRLAALAGRDPDSPRKR